VTIALFCSVCSLFFSTVDFSEAQPIPREQKLKGDVVSTTARVLASQTEAIVRTAKHGHNIE